MLIAIEDFTKVDIRVGTIIDAQPFPEARKPSYKLQIDCGPLGVFNSSAQITHYKLEELIGIQVACVVNFPPRQIGNYTSQVLTLAFPDAHDKAILVSPRSVVPNGGCLH